MDEQMKDVISQLKQQGYLGIEQRRYLIRCLKELDQRRKAEESFFLTVQMIRRVD